MRHLAYLLVVILCSCGFSGKKISQDSADTVFINKEDDPFLYFEPDSLSQYPIINSLNDVVCSSNTDTVMKWIEIEQFQNKYLFFLTNNPGGVHKYIFCGEQFYEIVNSGDESGAQKIISMQKISSKEYTYTVVNYDTKENRKIKIYVIDEKRKIAVLRDDMWGDMLVIAQQDSYNLPVLRQFNPESPIIVPFDRFDKVDFEKLLKEKGFK